jgi:hypothetical protein
MLYGKSWYMTYPKAIRGEALESFFRYTVLRIGAVKDIPQLVVEYLHFLSIR